MRRAALPVAAAAAAGLVACAAILGVPEVEYVGLPDGETPRTDAASPQPEQVFVDPDADIVGTADVTQGRYDPLSLAGYAGTLYAFLTNRGNAPAGRILGCVHEALGWTCSVLLNGTADNLPQPLGTVAPDGGSLIWCEDSTNGAQYSVASCPLSGLECQDAGAVPTSGSVFALAVDDQYAHYTLATSVMHCALPSCSAPEATFDGGQPRFVASDGTRVYWSDETPPNHSIYSCNITSCATPAQFVTGAQTLALAASRDGTVYWINAASQLLSWCPTCPGGDGGLALEIASTSLLGSGQPPPPPAERIPRMAVDDSYVYWTFGAPGPLGGLGGPGGIGGVAACLRAGCSAPIILATGQLGAGPIAVDDRNVYWGAYTAADHATLWVIPKPQ
jgi:hypothetical protein